MKETQKQNMTGSRCKTKHDEENSDNGHNEHNDDVDKHSADGNCKHCEDENENDINSVKNLFQFLNRFID